MAENEQELTPEQEGLLSRIKHWETQLGYSRHAVEVAERSLEALYKERDESIGQVAVHDQAEVA